MKCPFCGKELHEDAKFCTGCGKPIPRCPTCGKLITKRTKFCTADGTPIPEEILALFPEQPTEPAAAPAAPQSTCARCGKPVAEGRKLCDECRAVLLAARKSQQPAAACTRCGQPAEPGQKYCAQCRQSIEAMQGATVVIPAAKVSHFCTQCGKTVAEGEHLCAACKAKAAPKAAPKKKSNKKGGMIALSIVLVVLVLGLVGVLVYAIAAGDLLSPPSQSQSHKDNDRDEDKDQDDKDPTGDEDPVEDEEPVGESTAPATEAPTVPCTELVLRNKAEELTLKEADQVVTLDIAFAPSDTTDTFTFTSSSPAVATVNDNGRITAVSEGKAIITVTCGEQTLKVNIVCDFGVDADDALTYFVENCDKIQFTTADLEGFDKEMARIARNAVFAKSGRKFKDAELQAYFEQFDWYEPKYDPSSFDTDLLNSIQDSNLVLVTEYETARGWR
ncbi:MAG: zinc ribbon domain-containing protein [Oscillospiraceae bacterium]|nr:zinc ribbon domain-containing protein [Oscillospiraceae bacterium]